jgi:predicted amidohydrolase
MVEPMAHDRLEVALLSEVFPDAAAQARLCGALAAAGERGADLVVLPELPLHPWSPAKREARIEDAEPPLGPRHRLLAEAAREASVAVLGGVIVEDDGVRRNRALLLGRDGELLASYDKVHLPHEEGFWERDHYQPGDRAVPPVRVVGFPVGVQVCSDLNRPVLGQALAAAGALALLGPRATESGTWPRWRLVLQATALTASCYVLSVNRPRPEQGVPLGGPSFAVGPDGEVILETTEPLALVTLERAAVARAQADYPGYLALRPAVYADAWDAASRGIASEGPSGEERA